MLSPYPILPKRAADPRATPGLVLAGLCCSLAFFSGLLFVQAIILPGSPCNKHRDHLSTAVPIWLSGCGSCAAHLLCSTALSHLLTRACQSHLRSSARALSFLAPDPGFFLHGPSFPAQGAGFLFYLFLSGLFLPRIPLALTTLRPFPRGSQRGLHSFTLTYASQRLDEQYNEGFRVTALLALNNLC